MNALVDTQSLKQLAGSYRSGRAADALLVPALLQTVRMRRRQLGQMMSAFDIDTAKRRLPPADYVVSRKIDGEYTCLIYDNGDVITMNPGGTVRTGADFHREAATLLESAGIKKAIVGGELYVRRDDGNRARVHDVTRVARAPKDEDEVASLCFGVFDIYDLDGTDPSMRHSEAIATIAKIFGAGDRVHPVEHAAGDHKFVLKQFRQWVLEDGAEGVVARSDSAGIYKIKPRHSLDLAVVGFSEGTEDRTGMLHSLLLAVVRPEDNTFHIVSRVGGGFSDEARVELLKSLSRQVVESDYAEVNSDRVAYQMLKPGVVAEISCLDIISRTSHGNTIDRMVIEWDAKKKRWEGVRRLPLASIISPQFVRLREDKQAIAEDIKMTQLSDIADIPETDRAAENLKLPKSTVLQRTVATKELRGATMVRKILLWKTNKEDVTGDYPAYVLHLTDYSPNRKRPLNHDVVVSSSLDQMEEVFETWRKKYFVRGWNEME